MLIVDSFAGGGGASTGIEMALGRSPDIAINHDPVALAMHAANHPDCEHLTENVWQVDLEDHARRRGQAIGLLWASPDCRHFSKARGGRPTSPSVRGLAWTIVKFVRQLGPARQPRVIIMENVEEFLTWEDFDPWKKALRGHGYTIEMRELRACDYGAPTIRKRLFIIMRCDGEPNRFVSAPFFTANGGMGRRQCTREFKIGPLEKLQRELLGYMPRQRIPKGSAEVWIGFSTDEVVRAGAAFTRWAVNRFPLLEQRMSRHDCIRWLERRDYPVPPKSACVFCPFRSNAEWRWLRDNDPDAWEEAKRIDALIRNTPSMSHAEFLHADRVPLAEVDLSTPEDRGQGWLLECEGGCGL